MIWTKDFLPDLQRPLVQRPCCGVIPLDLKQGSQVVEACGYLRMVWAKGSIPGLQGPPLQPPYCGVVFLDFTPRSYSVLSAHESPSTLITEAKLLRLVATSG